MKYKYANQIFLHLISSFVWFCSIYKQCNTENNFGSYRQLIFLFFFLVVFLDKDVIYLTVKPDNKNLPLEYTDVEQNLYQWGSFCIYQLF